MPSTNTQPLRRYWSKVVNEKQYLGKSLQPTQNLKEMYQIVGIDLPKNNSLQIIKTEGGLRTGDDFYPLEYINPKCNQPAELTD